MPSFLRERVDFRGDVAEVFGDEGQSAEFVLEGAKQIKVGSGRPVAVDRGWVLGRNLPAGLETAEVVEADDVAGCDGPLHALDPPVVAAGLERVPVVERIAPALAGFAESIGRNAGDHLGREIGLEAEDIGMGPDIRAVVADKDGDIANDADAALGTVTPQRLPLLEEGKLQEALDVDGSDASRCANASSASGLR